MSEEELNNDPRFGDSALGQRLLQAELECLQREAIVQGHQADLYEVQEKLRLAREAKEAARKVRNKAYQDWAAEQGFPSDW